MTNSNIEIEPCLLEAILFLRQFINKTTNVPPSDAEIADALKKYFVLNEIKEHILMQRQNPTS
ncbi:MAG: hypothetical protein HQK79_10850 [Desulfobacterales bacterium]|nr:hypothetical protein [Desulfobacterales bacterium]MBF0396485.1 hypothetical protein [Desulfobacterales bacterium]